jgi:hypothetical protein
LRLTASLSQRVGGPLFFFAADDESTDMAMAAVDGLFSEYRLDFGTYLINFGRGVLTVVPRTFSEDPERTYSEDVLAEIRSIPGVEVAPPVVIEGGDMLYGSAVALWPSEAGDPAETLGIGTWDPFMNVEDDYDEVFTRSCPATDRNPALEQPRTAVASRKPWWKFW